MLYRGITFCIYMNDCICKNIGISYNKPITPLYGVWKYEDQSGFKATFNAYNAIKLYK